MFNKNKSSEKSKVTVEKRPWGQFEEIGRFTLSEQGKEIEIVIKRITVNPQSRLSLQSHINRSEQWNVIFGTGEFVIADKKISVKVGDCANVLKNEKHRIVNNNKATPLVIVEVGRGRFDENDIVRYEDDYGRVVI